MRPSAKPVLTYTLALFTLALVLALTSDSQLRPEPAQAISVSPTAVPDLSGVWHGSWTDTRYSVSGSLSMNISLSGSDYTATGTIDVSEINPMLGTLSGSASGTLSGNSLSFTFDATDLGSGSGSFTDGSASGTGTVTAPLNFGAFEFAGTVVGDQMTGTFNFTSPTGGNGTAQLSQGVPNDAATWSEVKSSY